MIRFLGYVLLFGIATSIAVAQTSETVISQRIISDLTPPTIPGSLAFTLVTDTQISLSWAASTDNQVLGGYQLFRDGTAIATTTLTTFADTNVSASTTYSYAIRAFDHILNYSTTSASISTTTRPAPVIPPPKVATIVPPFIELTYSSVEPVVTEAFLSWRTNGVVRHELRWGETGAYELGFVTSETYSKSHQTFITGLDPNTTYQYILIAYRRSGERVVLAQDQFRTYALPDSVLPANVSNFAAVGQGADVQLTWNNPDDDFDYVRIVRNPTFYPTDPNNGYIAYQGTAERFLDKNILPSDGIVYYTAFTYDEAGNRSSGAVTFAVGPEVTELPSNLSRSGVPLATEPTTDPDATTDDGTDPIVISFSDIYIIQDEVVIEAVDDTFLVDTNRPFTMQAPVHLFPKNLKIIQLTLKHPTDPNTASAYLLRMNPDQSAYETTIGELDYTGTIPIQLGVYDYNTETLTTADGFIVSLTPEPEVSLVTNTAHARSSCTCWQVFYWQWCLCWHWWWIPTLFLLYVWWRQALRAF